MKHQGYGKVVELPKVNDFMDRRSTERGGVGGGGLAKRMRGKGSGGEGSQKNERYRRIYFELTHSHTHVSLLSQCFGRSGRIETPNVIMKFNYNSPGRGMEMSSRVSVSPVVAT